MQKETLITTKVTIRALRLIRRIVARTGEKQYRAWERIAEAEYENETQKVKGKSK